MAKPLFSAHVGRYLCFRQKTKLKSGLHYFLFKMKTKHRPFVAFKAKTIYTNVNGLVPNRFGPGKNIQQL